MNDCNSTDKTYNAVDSDDGDERATDDMHG